MRKFLGTLLYCAVFYGAAWCTVQVAWPILAKYAEQFPPQLAQSVASWTSIALMVVLIHMQRGGLNPAKAPYLLLFGGTCLTFGLSTAHPSQFNAGTASLQLAFLYQCLWALAGLAFGKKEEAKQ